MSNTRRYLLKVEVICDSRAEATRLARYMRALADADALDNIHSIEKLED